MKPVDFDNDSGRGCELDVALDTVDERIGVGWEYACGSVVVKRVASAAERPAMLWITIRCRRVESLSRTEACEIERLASLEGNFPRDGDERMTRRNLFFSLS